MASFSAQPGSAQALGYGLGNYVRLFEFQEGLPRYFLNSVVVAVLTVAITLSVSPWAGSPSPASTSGARTRCSC